MPSSTADQGMLVNESWSSWVGTARGQFLRTQSQHMNADPSQAEKFYDKPFSISWAGTLLDTITLDLRPIIDSYHGILA